MESKTKKGRSFDHRHIGVGIVLLSLVIPFSYYPSGFSIILEGWLFSFPVSEITRYITTDFQYASYFLLDFLMLLTPHVFLGHQYFCSVFPLQSPINQGGWNYSCSLLWIGDLVFSHIHGFIWKPS
jgi:hypothetical protein